MTDLLLSHNALISIQDMVLSGVQSSTACTATQCRLDAMLGQHGSLTRAWRWAIAVADAGVPCVNRANNTYTLQAGACVY